MDTSNQTATHQRTPKEYLGLVLRGFFMGASDVVPGVSGGTMAFILGIYEELIYSIKSIDLKVAKLFISFRIKEAFAIIPWQFLLSVTVGIFLAILSLAKGLEWLLENKPILLWPFFFGLILASIIMVSKKVKNWSLLTVITAILATIVAYFIVGANQTETPDTLWFVFFSGAIAICAMILPGISGSFILVLLGKYQYILSAFNDRDIMVLITFMLGAGIGIMTFAQVLSWLFKKYHDLTVAMLAGFMLGSLRKIWDETNLALPVFEQPVSSIFINQAILAFCLAIFGFIIVLVLEYLATKKVQN